MCVYVLFMKRKKVKVDAKAVESTQALVTKPSQPAPVVVTMSPGEVVEMAEMTAPPPDFLEREADAEPNRRHLRDYFGVMQKLREKGFSFRDIAEWLN